MRIGFVGCAGLGKTLIASTLASKLQLPAFLSKDATRTILDKYGYKYSENQPVEMFLSRCDVEFEIVDKRISEENALMNGFVADRTTLECFCYSFFNLKSYSDDDFTLLESLCRESVLKYDRLYFMPFKSGWFDENGIRTINSQFQRQIDVMLRGLINDWELKNVIFIPLNVAKTGTVIDFVLADLWKNFPCFNNSHPVLDS